MGCSFNMMMVHTFAAKRSYKYYGTELKPFACDADPDDP
jgi:hypothetical protein